MNLAGVAQLPWRFELGLNFSYSSAPPFNAYVGGIDFNGDGTTDDLLPGTTLGQFNRGLGRADLVRLVDQFNQTYGGTTDPHGRAIPRLTLPDHYALDDNFHSLDLRLSRSFMFRERWRVSLIGEVFNLYNNANLTGYSGDSDQRRVRAAHQPSDQVFRIGRPARVPTCHESHVLSATAESSEQPRYLPVKGHRGFPKLDIADLSCNGAVT